MTALGVWVFIMGIGLAYQIHEVDKRIDNLISHLPPDILKRDNWR